MTTHARTPKGSANRKKYNRSPKGKAIVAKHRAKYPEKIKARTAVNRDPPYHRWQADSAVLMHPSGPSGPTPKRPSTTTASRRSATPVSAAIATAGSQRRPG
jgi:hypothetical protein